MTPAERALRDAIATDGPVTFAAAMELALYHPESGFYAVEGRAGRHGDFLTSPEVGPLFGAVVGRALDEWWDEAGRPAVFEVVEAGAGTGTLARSIRAAAPRCRDALRLVLVERSASQRARHATHLPLDRAEAARPPAPPSVVSLPGLPPWPGPRWVLANELLDNLPFGLLERTSEGWAEVCVTVDGDRLSELLVPTADRPTVDAAVGARLPRQQAAADWVQAAVDSAGPEGRVAVIDYASSSAEMAARPWLDWVRTYRGHARGGAPLEALGTQDITCEVAVDQLPAPTVDRSQADWLRAHGIDELVAEGRALWHERAAVGDLAAVRARSRVTEAAALLDPTGLGAFRVLEY